jgi:hypothetical protein
MVELPELQIDKSYSFSALEQRARRRRAYVWIVAVYNCTNLDCPLSVGSMRLERVSRIMERGDFD